MNIYLYYIPVEAKLDLSKVLNTRNYTDTRGLNS